jgi:hypothetical protein
MSNEMAQQAAPRSVTVSVDRGGEVYARNFFPDNPR